MFHECWQLCIHCAVVMSLFFNRRDHPTWTGCVLSRAADMDQLLGGTLKCCASMRIRPARPRLPIEASPHWAPAGRSSSTNSHEINPIMAPSQVQPRPICTEKTISNYSVYILNELFSFVQPINILSITVASRTDKSIVLCFGSFILKIKHPHSHLDSAFMGNLWESWWLNPFKIY